MAPLIAESVQESTRVELSVLDVVQVVETHPEAADCLGIVKSVKGSRVIIAFALPRFWGSEARDLEIDRRDIVWLGGVATRLPTGR